VYSRIAPIKLHENETNEISKHLEHVGKKLKIVSKESEETGEHNKLVGNSQVRGKIVEIEEDKKMDLDQSETFTNINTSGLSTEISDKLLVSDQQISNASKDELKDLVKRIKVELEKRKETGQSSVNFQESSQKLEQQLQKSEAVLNRVSADNSPKPNSILPTVSVIGVVASLFGGLMI